MTMQNENTPTEGKNSDKQTAESALRDAACCGFFICPDGDLHTRRPVEAIWIETIERWWNRKYRVCLQFRGSETHDWEWDKKTREEAVRVRDRLISILHNDQGLATQPAPEMPEKHK